MITLTQTKLGPRCQVSQCRRFTSWRLSSSATSVTICLCPRKIGGNGTPSSPCSVTTSAELHKNPWRMHTTRGLLLLRLCKYRLICFLLPLETNCIPCHRLPNSRRHHSKPHSIRHQSSPTPSLLLRLSHGIRQIGNLRMWNRCLVTGNEAGTPIRKNILRRGWHGTPRRLLCVWMGRMPTRHKCQMEDMLLSLLCSCPL